MKLLILHLALISLLNTDAGNIGRYEVEIKTKFEEEFKGYITVETYDNLKSDFDSDKDFKSFLFNLYGYNQLDTFQFYKEFHFVNYPEYKNRSEKLTSVLLEDWINLAKVDIEEIKFVSFKKIDFIGIITKLSKKEIKQTKNRCAHKKKIWLIVIKNHPNLVQCMIIKAKTVLQ